MSRLHLQLPLLLAMFLAACGSSSTTSTKSTTSTPSSGAELATRTLPGVGSVLVNAQGRTLYIFAPDKAKTVTCTGACAAVWPPLSSASGGNVSGTGAVKASLISSDANPSGGRVVTYAGWPLYLYTADPQAGSDNGQGINSSGGLWYVISPSGQVVKAKTSSGGSSSGGSAY